MKCHHFLRVCGIFFALFLASVDAEDHALLVGVSQYPNLEKERWLRGPENDVKLMAGLLRKRFGLKAGNIQELTSWPKDKAARPTKSNIRKAFARLAAKASSGDNVFILMSGHGCQQPADSNPADLEPDGLDELFLPADTARWDPMKKTVAGAIVDDEVREWVDEIRQKDAFVWIVFDSCHSGTMTRGTVHENRVNRRIDPALLIPKEHLQSAGGAKSGFSVKAEQNGEFSSGDADQKGGIVAIYAAQSLEPTFELPLPSPLGDPHGLLTFTLAQILINVKEPLSYRDLAETVSMIYRAQGVFQPTPLIEGTGLDREVMGKREFPARPQIAFTGVFLPPSSYEVDSGHLMGLREGSVIEVFPPAAAANSDQPLGTAKVVKAMATRALVSPAKWKGSKPVPQNRVSGGCRAAIVYEKMALDRMQVAIQLDDGTAVRTSAVKDLPKAQADVISNTPNRHRSWAWTDSLENAAWILRFTDSKPFLIPASGWSSAFEAQSPPEFKASSAAEIGSALNRIARTRQLVHIASQSGGFSDVRMDVELIRFVGSGDNAGKAVPHTSQGRILRNGDEIAFRITNRGRTSIDVSLLFVDSGYGITGLFPEPGTIDDNRIPPAKSLVTPRLEVTSETAGAEQVVALGVRSTRDRVDFSCLEQASLERTRGMPALDTPLGELLRGVVYGDGETRGLSRSRASDHATKLITWTTLP